MIIWLVCDKPDAFADWVGSDAAVTGARVGAEAGASVVAVTTAADTTGAGVVTPEKTFASIDPAASVTFKNCCTSITENGLAPPLTELTAAVRVVLTEAVSAAELLPFTAELIVNRTLYITSTPVGSEVTLRDNEESGASTRARLVYIGI